MNTPAVPLLLELRDIDKRFGQVQALQGASLAVAQGEVHALLGENGAGKSTLVNVAYGLVRPDGGSIEVLGKGKGERGSGKGEEGSGRRESFRSPREARAAGIGLVHQHFTSIPALTVAENIALFAGWSVAPGQLHARVAALTSTLSLPLDPRALAGSLPVALLQRLEIVKTLAADARVLLLDEPTGVLAPSEVTELLARARAFAEAGGAVVLITHKLDEALRAADRVTVLRRGRVVMTEAVGGLTPRDLVEAMIGDASLVEEPPVPAAPGVERPWRIRAGGISVRREHDAGLAVEGAWISVRAGEIVAVAGVEGSGQRELLRAIAGVLPLSGGTLEVAQPLSFVPEDRTVEGLIPALSLTENVALGVGRRASWVRGQRMDWGAARARTAELMKQYDVRGPGPDAAARQLSGGNQQKLIVARALERGPVALVAENPTRGLDVQATRAVHDRLREAAQGGLAVLMYSSDLDEVLALGQRVLVMARGRLIEVPPGATHDEIGRVMLVGRS